MKTCLVIVDVQNGFVSKRTRYVPQKIHALVQRYHFDHVVATRFLNTMDSPYVKFLGWTGLMGNKEQALDDTVAGIVERVFTKKGYTCFTPAFFRFVQESKIDRLVLCGIDTDCCVLKSAIDAFERGLQCDVVCDCCASNGGMKSHMAALLVLRRTIGAARLLQISDFIKEKR